VQLQPGPLFRTAIQKNTLAIFTFDLHHAPPA
jgi:hypothetical protein